MFVARGIEFGEEPPAPMEDATSAGRGYAVAGGVAEAISNCIRELYPELEVKMDRAEGLKNCKKMLALAKAGKRNGYLMEGMACPGGCIAGAGTIQPIKKTAASLEQMKKQAPFKESMDTEYEDMLPTLEEL